MKLKVNYSKQEVSQDYYCEHCKAKGLKLWRLYNTCAISATLLCASCMVKDQSKWNETVRENIAARIYNNVGYYIDKNGRKTDQCWSYVPAVPCENIDTFWGYTSIPSEGYEWWQKLPTR